ncbi:MAG: type II toxin-antitoxin system VapC family toxin [Pseudomonadota bacterium]|nr:type II toxin-antitoxin system VapC family toxin [Pseudomonadota bacterium]
MNVIIDSSAWLEYFIGGQKSGTISKFLRHPHKIILPSIVTYEVYKKIRKERGEQMAVLLLAQMERFSQSAVSIDQGLAVKAADVSLEHNIPMADAMIYTCALFSGSIVVTMDSHFKGLPQVKFIA